MLYRSSLLPRLIVWIKYTFNELQMYVLCLLIALSGWFLSVVLLTNSSLMKHSSRRTRIMLGLGESCVLWLRTWRRINLSQSWDWRNLPARPGAVGPEAVLTGIRAAARRTPQTDFHRLIHPSICPSNQRTIRLLQLSRCRRPAIYSAGGYVQNVIGTWLPVADVR